MRLILLGGILVSLLCGGAALAQETQPATVSPAQIGVLEGSVTLEREGGVNALDAAMPIVPGDRLRTGQGRVEILLGDGSVLAVDEDSTLDMLSTSLMRLLAGRVYLMVAADPEVGT